MNQQHFIRRTAVVLVFTGWLGFVPSTRGAEPPAARFGFEQRVRNENWNNLFDYNDGLDDERRQIRYRTRVWASLPVGTNVVFNLGLNSETNQKIGQTNTFDELVFDIANVEIRRLWLPGLSLKAGRQDLLRGEGLVLSEGTPGDGSRTTYFNAVNLAYAFGRTRLEALAIAAPKYDRMLPRFHDRHKPLVEHDEQAFGLYLTDQTLPRTTVEAYLFRKRESRDRMPRTSAQWQPDRRVDTAGVRVSRTLSKQWSITGETAQQWGVETPSRPIRAFAAYTYLRRNFEARFSPFVTGGYWVLSGDDPQRADRVGGWDPLFSRYARWGDLELYSEAPEYGVGYATNQKRWQLESGLSPAKALALRFTYYRLGAFHPFARSSNVFGTGCDRGNNFQVRGDFRLNANLRGHVDYQTLLPGSFYANRDRSYFLRFELIAETKTAIREFWKSLR